MSKWRQLPHEDTMTTLERKRLENGQQLGPQLRALRISGPAKSSQDDEAAEGEAPAQLVGEDRTLELSFSSDAPIRMGWYTEKLSHESGAADLLRLNNGAALLFNHNRNDVLGVLEKAWIDEKSGVGRCLVRFGRDARGQWAMDQVNDGILSLTSFMYQPREMKLTKESDDGDEYTTTAWEAFEVSLVTVPADPSVGVGRAATGEGLPVKVTRPAQSTAADAEQNQGKRTMEPQVITPDATGAGAADPAKLEAERKQAIEALCQTNGIAESVRNAMIAVGVTIEQARGLVLNEVLMRGGQLASLKGTDPNPDLTAREKKSYSLIRAAKALAMSNGPDSANAWKDAGFEREVSQEISKRTGQSTVGFFMPTNIDFAMRAARAADYSVGTGAGLSATSGGANLVATNLLAGSFIDILRNKARVMQLGARMLSGLVGNIDIPRQKAAGAVYWGTEGFSLTQTGGQFDKVSMSPKTVGALSIITRQMMLQNTPDVEMLARADLLSTMALGIDAAALYGSNASGQPKGIANTAGIGSVVGGTNGAALTIDHLIDLETQITVANADVDAMSYLVNAKTTGTLKKLKDTTGRYLWNNTSNFGQRVATPGEINGYTVGRTNQVRGNLTKGSGTNLSEVYFADWSQLLIGEWGVVEILPNPYLSGVYEAGSVALRVMQSVDIAVRHPESFSYMGDAIA
jgi:HK97 family phage major capsid protein/HK97 family phage prohead protease